MAKLPKQKEIDDVLNQCAASEDSGVSEVPGMTYEQGVKAGIEWLQGSGSNPMDN